MTQDEIIEMVRQAGWSGIYTQWAEPTGEADWSPVKVSLTVPVTMKQIETFAKLVAAKATEEANARANASWTLMCEKMVAFEREACAKVCDEYSAIGKIEEFDRGWLACAKNIASVIRARGNA